VVIVGDRARGGEVVVVVVVVARVAGGAGAPATPQVTRRSLCPKSSPRRQDLPRDRPALGAARRPIRLDPPETRSAGRGRLLLFPGFFTPLSLWLATRSYLALFNSG
jgi:hypothetical protein